MLAVTQLTVCGYLIEQEALLSSLNFVALVSK